MKSPVRGVGFAHGFSRRERSLSNRDCGAYPYSDGEKYSAENSVARYLLRLSAMQPLCFLSGLDPNGCLLAYFLALHSKF